MEEEHADQSGAEPVPVLSWTGALSPFILLPILLVMALALWAPKDVLERWPAARFFCDAVVSRFSFVSGQAGSTQYPQAALLVNCILLVAVPALGFVQMILSIELSQILETESAVQAAVSREASHACFSWYAGIYLGLDFVPHCTR